MIQGIRKKISYIQLRVKLWISFISVFFLSFIIVFFTLSCLIYIIIFIDRIIESQNVSSVLISFLGTTYTKSFKNITPDNVISILGTLAQSNAAILAIVISLSLVVIEFSASKYSARVVDVFKRDPILWGFLLLYGFSIFIPVYLITLIDNNTNSSTSKLYFILAYALSIIAYISLFYYIFRVFKMMKPSSVVKILSKGIGIQTLSSSSEEVDKRASRISKDEPKINRIRVIIKDEKDPVLPIIDIIRASIMQYDYTTARDGLGAVSECLINVLRQNPLEERRISEHVFQRIYEIWKLALKNKDSEFVYMIMMQYWYIGVRCTDPIGKPGPAYLSFILKLKTKFLIPSYNTLNKPYSEEITQSTLLYTTFLSAYFLKEAFKSIVEVKDEEFQHLSIILTDKINEIVSETFENRYELRIEKPMEVIESLEGFVSELSYLLNDIGIAAVNKGSKSAFNIVIRTFNYMGEAAIYHNLIHSIPHILENFEIIGKESTKKGKEFELLTEQVVDCLENLASKINSHSQELTNEEKNKIVEYYEYIKLNYNTYETQNDSLEELKNKERLDISEISNYIAIIGEESIKNNLLDATKQCLKSLEVIERVLKNDTESIDIGKYIKNLGFEAVKKEQTYPLMKDIINSIYSIGMLQFGYMFDWDRDRDNWNIDRNKYRKFLQKEYNEYSGKRLQVSYSEFVEAMHFENMEDFYYGAYPDDKIYGERTLIIDDKKRKDIKCLNLKDIEDGYYTLKLFKEDGFKNSERAYYEVPVLLNKIVDPILEYALNSPTNETINPFTMIIRSFENFGILSIHFRDEFSLNKIFIRNLVEIGDSFFDFKYSEYNNDNEAWEYLDWATTVVSNSIYKLAIISLRYNFVDFDTLRLQIECLIRIQKKYHNCLFDVENKFKRILEMIKESELKESEREEIVTITENAIEEFKNRK